MRRVDTVEAIVSDRVQRSEDRVKREVAGSLDVAGGLAEYPRAIGTPTRTSAQRRAHDARDRSSSVSPSDTHVIEDGRAIVP